MDDQFDFFKLLQEHLGWTIATFSVMGVSIISLFAKYLSGALGKYLQDSLLHKGIFWMKRTDLTRHPLFSKYRFLINQRLKHISCHCPLRKKIFCDLMLIRVAVYDRIIREFVKRDDLNRLSIAEFQYTTNELLLRIFSEWEDAAREKGIPPVVIARFLEATRDIRHSLIVFTQSLSNSSYTYADNFSRVSAILDMLCGFEETVLMKLEESLDRMNGEVSGTRYKGLECLSCENCQSRHRQPPRRNHQDTSST